MKMKFLIRIFIVIFSLIFIESSPQKLENNSEITILSKKESRYFYYEVPGEGSTFISIQGKGDLDESELFINESCSKKCISKDVDQPSRTSNCYGSDSSRYNFVRQTSTEKCLIYIGVNPKKISLGLVLNIKYEPIVETNNGFENWVDINYDFNRDYKYFSYTLETKKKGTLNIYSQGISNYEEFSINYSSNCSSCSLKNIIFPNRNTYCGQTDNKNYNVVRLDISDEKCKIYFSIYNLKSKEGIQVKVKFDEYKNMINSNEFTFIQTDKEAYRYFSFIKEKSMGQGLIWLIVKNQEDQIKLYTANNYDGCQISSDFIYNGKSCYSTSYDSYQSKTFYYSDPNSEDKIRFSVYSRGNIGFYVKTIFMPIVQLKINQDFIKFTALEDRSYNFFKIPVSEEFIGSNLKITVVGQSVNEENNILMTTEKREDDCSLNDVIFPKADKSCYNTCNGNCSYYSNKRILTFSVKQSQTLYLSVLIKDNNGGSLIKVESDKKLLFLSD